MAVMRRSPNLVTDLLLPERENAGLLRRIGRSLLASEPDDVAFDLSGPLGVGMAAGKKAANTLLGKIGKASGLTRKFFRGANPNDPRRIDEAIESARSKTFVAKNIESAKAYGPHITEFESLPNARILDEGTPEFKRVTGRRGQDMLRSIRPGENYATALSDAVQKAEDAGYDAVSFLQDSDVGTVILNNDAFKIVRE